MQGLEEIFGKPEVLIFDEKLYQKNIQEHDFSNKLTDMRSEEEKEVVVDVLQTNATTFE
jgi:hypothetical protein